jgi:hypothetical protein
VPNETRLRVLAARGIPDGVIVCSYATRKAILDAGIEGGEYEIPPSAIMLDNGTRMLLDAQRLTDSQIVDALSQAVNGIGR